MNPIRRISMFSTGTVRIRPEHVRSTGLPMLLWLVFSRRWTDPLPINVYVIEHELGVILFDTGQDRASVTDSEYFPKGMVGWLYRRLASFDIAPSETLAAKLAGLGYSPSEVTHAVLSHLHQDHIGGIAELPGATIVVNEAEWAGLASPLALLDGLMREHIDLPGVTWKRVALQPTADNALAPFENSHDLLGDGSLTLVSTPGHTPGSMSLLVRAPGVDPLLLVGDLTYDERLLRSGRVPGVGSARRLRATTAVVNEYRRRMPGLAVLAAHDPGAATLLAAALRDQSQS